VPGYQFKTRAPLLQFAETEQIADEARNRNVYVELATMRISGKWRRCEAVAAKPRSGGVLCVMRARRLVA
jgi:hypothetical protein